MECLHERRTDRLGGEGREVKRGAKGGEESGEKEVKRGGEGGEERRLREVKRGG